MTTWNQSLSNEKKMNKSPFRSSSVQFQPIQEEIQSQQERQISPPQQRPSDAGFNDRDCGSDDG
jgi:hypothetical protein